MQKHGRLSDSALSTEVCVFSMSFSLNFFVSSVWYFHRFFFSWAERLHSLAIKLLPSISWFFGFHHYNHMWSQLQKSKQLLHKVSFKKTQNTGLLVSNQPAHRCRVNSWGESLWPCRMFPPHFTVNCTFRLIKSVWQRKSTTWSTQSHQHQRELVDQFSHLSIKDTHKTI